VTTDRASAQVHGADPPASPWEGAWDRQGGYVGTVCPTHPVSRRPRRGARDVAGAFRSTFGQTFDDRTLGQYASIEHNIAQVCAQLGVHPTAAALQAAAAHRYAFTRRTLTPSPDVLAALDALKCAGFRLGLLSNCGPDVPHRWRECPLAASIDVAVFSCQARQKKPAQALYQTA